MCIYSLYMCEGEIKDQETKKEKKNVELFHSTVSSKFAINCRDIWPRSGRGWVDVLLAWVVTVSVTYKNASVNVVTVAWRTRYLHIPDQSVGLFKPRKVQVKQLTNCTQDCVAVLWTWSSRFRSQVMSCTYQVRVRGLYTPIQATNSTLVGHGHCRVLTWASMYRSRSVGVLWTWSSRFR